MAAKQVDQTSATCFLLRLTVGLAVVLVLLYSMLRFQTRTRRVLAEISGGSMAPSYFGEHYHTHCPDCRLAFRFGVEQLPTDRGVVCPNCGYRFELAGDAESRPAQRVFIQPFGNDNPPRWAVVGVRSLEQENHEEIKRVVGLPGERIRLNHGDVYLDGAVVRKNLAEQHALAILVHDDAYRASKTNPPDRWRPPNATSGWKRENSRYVIDQQTTSPQANPTKGESSFDWLEYHHWPCYAASKPRTSEAPVRDHYGWNQNTSRALNVVTDLMLVCELASLGSGILAWEAHDGSEWFRVTWEESAGELTLSRGDTNVQTRRLPQKQSSGPYHIDFSLVDQQVLFSVNGQTSISFPYDRVWPPSNATTSPFRIGARGARMTVSQLTILRDVYYLHPFGDGVKWEMKKPLASDEYFLLGDNAPLSLDSRHRPRNPLRRKSLIGIIATD